MFPADQVETLERLIDEIERVSSVGKGAVRLRRKEKIRECRGGGAASNGRQHGTFGPIPMSHGDPATQPALESADLRLVGQRRTVPARGCTVAIRCHSSCPVKQSEMRLLLGQVRQKLAERGQDGKSGIPTVAVAGTEQRGLPYHVRG